VSRIGGGIGRLPDVDNGLSECLFRVDSGQ